MVRSLAILIIFLLLLTGGLTLSGCRKDRGTWTPEVVMVMKPDSGLTTQTFDFRVDILNLPVAQNEIYIRWDLNGDSLWDDRFTAFQSVTHRFYQKGVHSVRAEILTESGQRIVLSRKVKIEQGFSAPHASFSIDPPESNFLTRFTFDAGSTFDDEDSLSTLLFRWDFEDDGIWDTEPTNNPVVKHTFKKALIYRVKLSVTDPTKRAASMIIPLVVNLHDDLILTDFTWTPEEATVKDTFLLDASATRHEKDSTRIFSYQWDIQSEVVYGPFDTPLFPHMFWSSGMQKITLTATDQYGLSNSVTKEFYVVKENKPPVPKILASTPYGNIATNFFLSAWPSRDDVTAPSQLLIRWDFESDGNWDTGWSYEKDLFHQFNEPGEFWVTLEAEDEGGERGKSKTRILVSQYAVPTGYIQDRRDGKYYGTVKIGEQWWMSDNLDYRTNPKMDIVMLQKCYEEKSGMCDLYGALYQGERSVVFMNAGKNMCPDGWRLPARADWEKMAEQLPAKGKPESLLVGGSTGFNARYTGSGFFVFMYHPIYPDVVIDTIYTFSGLYQEVKYLSTTTRPHFNEYMAQFYMGFLRDVDAIDLMWGNLNGYFYVRCLKEE